MKSIWIETNSQKYPVLEKDLDVDILIVGGGICGLSLAYELKDLKQKIVVAEANNLGYGVTGNTTAHITSQHDDTYYRYLKRFGFAKAKFILEANEKAILTIKDIIDKENMNCDFVFSSSFLAATTKSGTEKIKKEYQALKELGYQANFIEHTADYPFPFAAALEFKNQAFFNPIKYIQGLAASFIGENHHIYISTRILRVRNNIAYGHNFKIKAKKIIITTHNPIINYPGLYFFKMFQDKSYAVAIQSDNKVDAMWNYIDGDKNTIRPYNHQIIMSGENHQTGFQRRRNHLESLKNQALKLFPDSKITSIWSAQDGITLDNLPYIGYYSKKSKDLLVVTGLGKWGMTTSIVSAGILKSLILNQENPLIKIYSPQRKKIPVALLNLIKYNLKALPQFAYWLMKPTNPTCPHLKCKTLYNRQEGTYECPCHGSRFSRDLKVIDSPAIHNGKPKSN